jgi:hypothetical protein
VNDMFPTRAYCSAGVAGEIVHCCFHEIRQRDARIESFSSAGLECDESAPGCSSACSGGGGRRSVSNSVIEASADSGRASRPFE